ARRVGAQNWTGFTTLAHSQTLPVPQRWYHPLAMQYTRGSLASRAFWKEGQHQSFTNYEGTFAGRPFYRPWSCHEPWMRRYDIALHVLSVGKLNVPSREELEWLSYDNS
ncbi:unnamed protein product, partial [Ectocarpus fasciculatus]